MPPTASADEVEQALLQRAIDAVCAGDAATLRSLLRDHPTLIQARVARTDPPYYDGYFRHATLFNHVACNPLPVKGPANLLEITRILIDAGTPVSQIQDALGGVVTATDDGIGDLRGPMVDLLVSAGAQVDFQGGVLEASLSYDTKAGVAALLRHHPTLDLRYAAGIGDVAALDRFFTADGHLVPSARIPDWRNGQPLPMTMSETDLLDEALSYAAMGGHVAIAERLLAHGANPNRLVPNRVLNISGRTALHAAALQGHLEVIHCLLDHGADPTITDPDYHGTPAGWANHFHYAACATVLAQAEQQFRQKAVPDPMVLPGPILP